MIRKNAVESILAERNILISVRNPFVVSNFPNSFLISYSQVEHLIAFSDWISCYTRFGFSIPSPLGIICIL